MTKQELDLLQPGDVIAEDDGRDRCLIVQITAVNHEFISYIILDTTVSTHWPLGFEGKVSKHKPFYSYTSLYQLAVATKAGCECGAERCGFNSHSYWCPRR